MSTSQAVPQTEPIAFVPKFKSPNDKAKENEAAKWIHDENETPPPWDAAIDDLAKLTEEKYETVRKKAAKRLSIDRIGKLDQFVETRRKEIGEQAAVDKIGRTL